MQKKVGVSLSMDGKKNKTNTGRGDAVSLGLWRKAYGSNAM